MKLTAFLLMLAFVQVSAKGYGQVTLHEKNAPFEKVMASIRKQTSYTIFYNERIAAARISIDVDHAAIKEALDKCFQNLPITYKIVGNSIFLKEKEDVPDVPKASVETAPLWVTVSGTILGEDKMPVEGASVFIKGSTIGTRTNANGYFRLDRVTDKMMLRITCIGYLPVEIGIRKFKDGYSPYPIEKANAENLSVDAGAEVVFTLRLVSAVGDLKGISVNGDMDATRQIGTVVDLKHRNHLNLGQVLEGSIPGLTLKSTTTSNTELSLNSNNYLYFLNEPGRIYTGVEQIKELYNRMLAANPGYRTSYPTFESFYNEQYAYANNSPLPGYISTATSTSNSGIVPELRGSSTFTGNTSGMLVVIDGLEQRGFPANYPMSNVAKIEVIKDPAELIKWGPKATGGLIMITTNGAKSGKLRFNYNSTFSYSGRPDISNSKRQLASSADVLSYYIEQVDKGLASYIPASGDFSYPPTGLKPAQWLLYNLKKDSLPYTNARFLTSWDSLANLSNRDQLRSLYQNIFTQGHSLTMTGGTSVWNFSLGGNYNNTPASVLGTTSTLLQVNMQNRFSLFKNKLNITWQLNSNRNDSKNSIANDGSSLDPYQLLLSPGGNYVYDYSNVSPSVNNLMQEMGYENNGVNPLEDARNTRNTNKSLGINSLLNINWDLSKDLRWSTLFGYDRYKGDILNLQGGATSQVRQLRNSYGSPDGNGGVTMYIPEGGILNSSHSKGLKWNMRSGFSYSHSFDERNVLTAAIGLGATHAQTQTVPNASIYGYGPSTPGGLPVQEIPEAGIVNYFGAIQYASGLQTAGFNSAFYDRSLSANGNIGYTYDQRYMLNVQYGSVYTPNAGFSPSYSGTKNYEAKASWLVSKEDFFSSPVVSTLTLSAIASKIQLGRTPDVVGSRIISQPLWNNTALVAFDYTPSQLNAQQITNIGGGFELGMWQERIYLKALYNHSSDGSHQVNGQVAYEIDREPWFNVPFINKLTVDLSLQNFNSLQAQAIVMGTNLPNLNGSFSLANNTSYSILPPATINKEAHLLLGMFRDRLIVDMRYYHKTISSTAGSGLLPPDPSTGVGSQLSYSRMLNKGIEFYLKAKLIQRSAFGYAVTINGAYNTNQALDIPNIPFTQLQSYLTAFRTGYATDALWSYRWAGLDNLGNPQVYKDVNTKVPMLSGTDANGSPLTTVLDASSLVYSGRTRAPWSGGLIQEWNYRHFFASARLMFNLGHVMRTYIPVIGPGLDRNILITQRWQKPGDEAHTDVAAMAPFNSTRSLVIQNASNSIVSASNFRLREVQLGYDVPDNILKKGLIKALTVSVQVQNLALWTRNKLGLDPDVISSNGLPGIQQPRQYMLTLNADF